MLTIHSELAREKMWARIHLIPALQAEEDRDQVRRHLADKAREKELLGTETKVYNTDRYGLWDLAFGWAFANHEGTDSFDLHLRLHPSTRPSRTRNVVACVNMISKASGDIEPQNRVSRTAMIESTVPLSRLGLSRMVPNMKAATSCFWPLHV